MKILFIGDIVGNLGLKAVSEYLPYLKDKNQFDFIIANAENSAPNGRGITKQAVSVLTNIGVNTLTMGNHTWDHDDIYEIIDKKNYNIIRPANYPTALPGRSYITVKLGNKNVTVINLCGQTFMDSFNCPFAAIDDLLAKIPKDHYIIVDFHAEATSEKIAMGRYLAGKVSAVFGTHTHVQTSDAQLIKEHTGYITDVGMTGCRSGVIGMEAEAVLKRFRLKIPVKINVDSNSSSWQFSAVIIELAKGSTSAREIKSIYEVS
ncbi:TIGR00282 family metallophosphoesterase [Desulfuribacillus alkaliarsenatis]|uniref:Metallophosphoesterase n=1 Tax=Desulfuribacillus alkaliarsenatis TaxID=766136 RepID=A0A1E5G6F6_9FIRM|nr:TIGR00282 family metallophosphoesterase [Desulfuribacillus alkaliarsenatis]OEF98679.1 hypothetical protein BHF68_03190 [Desulfuribacillus alkaliarsenatis]